MTAFLWACVVYFGLSTVADLADTAKEDAKVIDWLCLMLHSAFGAGAAYFLAVN